MALELRQQLKLTQQLVMTPQLQQAIKLLQFSRIELIETINQELESNPVLEDTVSEETARPEESAIAEQLGASDENWQKPDLPSLASSEDEKTPWEKSALEEIDWSNVWEEESRSALPAYSFEEKEQHNFENILGTSQDLAEHLMWQLQMTRLNETERRTGGLIIGNLNADGYLKTTVEEIAQEVGCRTDEVEAVLKKIQLFDPVGVAARDLRECLLIQLQYLEINDPLVLKLVSDHLHDIEKHDYQAMAKATGRTIDEIAHAVDIITGLEPRPGKFFQQEETHYIIPDIYVYRVDGKYEISLNEEGMPRLRISNYYRRAVEEGMAPDSAKEFIQGKLKSALWLIRSIHQRQRTIYKVAESIVKFQKEFLDKGIDYLKPLVLRDIADDVGMHESTISRVTTNKYIHTPQGIFELKFFFSAGLHRTNGDDVATQSVKEQIRKLINSENPTNPLSDKQLVDILAENDIRIARRTVAKYRNLMGILPTSRRKRPAMKHQEKA